MKRRLLVFASFILAALLLVSCGKAYNVEFDLDGGQLEGLVETVNVKKGKTVAKPEGNPTKEGHDFEGWYLDAEEYDFEAKVVSDLVIKAQWKKKADVEPVLGEFTVAFDVNNGQSSYVESQVVTEGQKAVKPATPVAPFYKFLGWYYGDVEFNFNRAITKDFILTAKWEALTVHNISYENVYDNDFGYASINEMMEAFFVDFYTYVNPDGVTLEQFVHAVPGDFNGFWKNYANDKRLYSGAISNLNKLDGKTFATHEVYGPKWFGLFEFLDDWIKGINSAQFFWTATGTSVSVGVTRLQQYAQGTKPVSSLNDEYMLQMPEELINYKPVKLYIEGEGTELPVPYRKLYAFEGWYDNSDFAGAAIESLGADAKGAKTLYAKWREYDLYNVITSLNYEGAKAIEPEEVYETGLATRPATPSRELFIFDGWHLDAEGEVPYDFTAPVMGNTVIYAKWLEAVFVTYDYDTEDVKDVVVKMVKNTKPAKPADPTKPGFKFDGWYVDLADEDAFDFAEKLEEDVELVAKWVELEQYTIEYEFNGGEMMPEFETRDDMVVAFLTDYYNFITGYPDVYDVNKDGNSLEEFIGDTGKPNDISVPTAPKYKYDGNFNTAMSLLTQQDMSVDLESRYFVAQLEYNKWRPLIEAMETYSHVGNPDQHIWGVAEFRVKPFIGMLDLWRYHDAPTTKIIKDAMELIPQQYLDPIEEYDEQSAFPLPFPIKDSAEFLGWYDNAEFTGDPIFAIEAGTKGDLELFAKWNELDIVKATYHFYDGQFETVIILKNNILEEPFDPERPLHEFGGWYTKEDFSGDKFDFDTELTKDIDLYAKWNPLPTVKVEFDPANDEDEIEVVIVKDTLVKKPETPIKDGYEFLGWFVGENAFDFEAEVAANVKVVAKWKEILSVVHHYDGGALGAQNMIDLLDSVHVVASRYAAGADPTGDSYSISTTKSVWWYALAFKETDVAMVYELVGKQGANVAADFDTSEVVFYVQYHDGLKGNFVSAIKQVYTDIKVGDLLVIPNLPAEMEAVNTKTINLYYFYEFKLDDQYPIRFDFFDGLVTPVKEGFMFDGWYKEKALTTEVEELPESIDANLNLYAKWVEIPEYTITLDQDYKVGDDQVVAEVKQYQDLPLAQPATPKRDGYLFTYWLLDGEVYDFNTPITEDITLVAGWYKLLTFDVTFEVDGEEYAVVPTEEYAAVVLPASPTKAGNIFAGWLLDGEEYDAKAPVEGDLKLVASWSGSVKVVYKLYDGMELTIEIVSGQKLAKPASPYREEFIFQRWVIDGKAFDFDTVITKETVIEAEWIPAPYRDITYVLNGGEFIGDFVDREVMIDAFLSDFYDYLGAVDKLDETLHPTLASFQEWYRANDADNIYMQHLIVTDADFEVNKDNPVFISQPQYNKWAPLVRLMNEYVVTVNATQTLYKVGDGPNGIGYARIRRFMMMHPYNAAAAAVAARIPAEYQQLRRYSIQSQVYTFSIPQKDRCDFLGWYDNAEFTGEPITKLNPELDEDITLYAKWSLPYYSITYVADEETLWPYGFNNREEMIKAFLKDWYDYLVAIDVLNKVDGAPELNSYEEFETWYLTDRTNDEFYINYLVTDTNDFVVNPENNKFISQAKYNGWLPLIKLMNTYTNTGNPDQLFYKSNGVGNVVAWARFKPFLQGRDLWGYVPAIPGILQTIPEVYVIPHRYNETINVWVVEKEDREFLGWYDNEEFTGSPIVQIDPAVDGDVVLYAKWSEVLEKYTVTFKLAEDDANPTEVVYFEGKQVVKPTAPVKEGYLFDKWLLDGVEYDFALAIDGDLILIAKWNESVKVTFEFDNGQEDVVEEIVKGTKVTAPKAPVKEGYDFLGWFDGDDEFDFEDEVEESVTLVAGWYKLPKVTFDLNGGVVKANEALEHIVATRYDNVGTGTEIVLGASKYAWWFTIGLKETDDAGVYEFVLKGLGKDIPAETEATLFISYHDSCASEYFGALKIIYSNIGEGDLVIIETLPEAAGGSKEIDIYFALVVEREDDVLTFYHKELSELLAAEKEGFDFDGWYKDEALTEALAALPETIEEDLILYAKWSAK